MSITEQSLSEGVSPQHTYHLTEEQIAFFDQHGYLILRQWIPQPMLARLQAAATVWIEEGLDAEPGHPHYQDYAYAQRAQGRTMFRVNYLHNKGQEASLELLGSPQVLGVAESLCGPNFVPTYESLVFKQEHDGAAIEWHQDAVHPRHHRIFNFDLYLDRSTADAGALHVIPGSQTRSQDICAIEHEWGWNPPQMQIVEMEPGDVLLHDVMVVHGSEPVEGKSLRRTIYYEFRAAEEILEDGPWDADWIDRRLRLVPLGLQQYAQTYPHESAFDWHIAEQFRPRVSEDQEAELKIAHVVAMSGTYCSAGSPKPF